MLLIQVLVVFRGPPYFYLESESQLLILVASQAFVDVATITMNTETLAYISAFDYFFDSTDVDTPVPV